MVPCFLSPALDTSLRFPSGRKTSASKPELAPGELPSCPLGCRPPWAHPGVKATTLPEDRLPHPQEGTPNPEACTPEDRRLPLLPLMIFPLLPMLASFEVFRVPVSVRSMAISLRLRAAWILD